MTKGKEGVDKFFEGESMPWFHSLANTLVFNKIKTAIGLDEVKVFVFGAAPLKKSTLKFFKSLSMPIFNTYGMSESSGPQFTNLSDKFVDLNSAGSFLKGTDIKINNPDKDGVGEICFRGRNRFMGYYKNEEATLESIDGDGFLHSGDQGFMNNKGNLFITGRFKEILKTAGGEMVAPVPIEEIVKDTSSIFATVVLIGDERKYLAILLTLNTDSTGLLNNDVLSVLKDVNPEVKTIIEAMADPKVKTYIQSLIDIVNKKATSRAQLIRRWTILPHDFSVESGELTPSLKIKRKFVAQKYAKEIETMYTQGKF